MAQTKKYQGMQLDLDQGPGIYETPDLIDDKSTDQTATVRTPSPTPSDEDGRHDPDVGLDRHHLDQNGARRRFERSTVNAQDVDFSDRLDGNRQSYKVKEKVYESEDESLSRKLARLRREAEEVKLELEKRKEGVVNGSEPEDEMALEDGVVKLSEMLDSLHTDSRPVYSTTFTSTAAFSRQFHQAAPLSVGSEGSRLGKSKTPTLAGGTPGSTTTAIAAFADRLSSLESALGLSSVPPTNESTPILPTLSSLSTQITTLSATLASSPLQPSSNSPSSSSRSNTTSSVPHLDALASRLRNLTSESDKLAFSRKRALETLHALQEARLRPTGSFYNTPTPEDLARDQAVPLFEDSSAKIAALYATLPTIQDLQPMLPVVLKRLRSLQVLHADATSAKGSMEKVEKQQVASNEEIKRWRKGLEDVEARMVEFQKVMGKNTEVIGKMVEDIEERLARLETQ